MLKTGQTSSPGSMAQSMTISWKAPSRKPVRGKASIFKTLRPGSDSGLNAITYCITLLATHLMTFFLFFVLFSIEL